MSDFRRRLLFYLVLTISVGTVWTAARAKALEDRASRAYWPAADPQLVQRVFQAAQASDMPECPTTQPVTPLP